MLSPGSYHLSGTYSRPLIVQVDLSAVSDQRDVLSEAASDGRPQRTCVSEANCAHTRTNGELPLGARAQLALEAGP